MEVFRESRTKVNGKFLHEFIGQQITILGRILKVIPNGSSFEMKSTDNIIINVAMTEPLNEPLDGWVEVRGVGVGRNAVKCFHYLSLPEDIMLKFDSDLYADLIDTIHSGSDNTWVNTNSN